MAAASYYTSLEADQAYSHPGHLSQGSTSSVKPLKLAAQNQHEFGWYDEHQQITGSDKVGIFLEQSSYIPLI